MSSAKPRRVGLLRAINLGAHNKVAMSDLRAFLTDLGLDAPQTLLQSGNIVFGSAKSPPALESWLETESREKLGLDVPYLVRTAEEWKAIIDGNPYRAEARSDPGHLLVVCFKSSVAPAIARALAGSLTAARKREAVHVAGRHAYVYYPDGIGTSKLTMTAIERSLGTVGTARNWNTALKIQALLN